jgi:hypothetical protein
MSEKSRNSQKNNIKKRNINFRDQRINLTWSRFTSSFEIAKKSQNLLLENSFVYIQIFQLT